MAFVMELLRLKRFQNKDIGNIYVPPLESTRQEAKFNDKLKVTCFKYCPRNQTIAVGLNNGSIGLFYNERFSERVLLKAHRGLPKPRTTRAGYTHTSLILTRAIFGALSTRRSSTNITSSRGRATGPSRSGTRIPRLTMWCRPSSGTTAPSWLWLTLRSMIVFFPLPTTRLSGSGSRYTPIQAGEAQEVLPAPLVRVLPSAL